MIPVHTNLFIDQQERSLLRRAIQQREEIRQRRFVLLIVSLIAQISALYHNLFLTARQNIPYHTSALTGQAWVLELMTGHPDRIWHNLGVNLQVFEELLEVIRTHGFQPSRNGVSIEEQLAIFLYTCVTGLPTRHVGERFQRSPDTITR